MHGFGVVGVAALMLAGCTVVPQPIDPAETEARIEADMAEMFADQEPLSGPLTLHQAMARAIKYNLDARLRTFEQALAQRQLDLSRFDMLPQVEGSAGIVSRTNESASSSESVTTRTQSLEPSTSQESTRTVADLDVVWNFLDFGVSYVTAEQNADRSLIAYERRRKITHEIIQDVRAAYWRAMAAERLLSRIDQLMASVEEARRNSDEIVRRRLQEPVQILSYQRTLLEILQRLEIQRRELTLAKTELATLINLPPGQDVTLAVPNNDPSVPTVGLAVDQMEMLALAFRPELREEDYQSRISAAETRKAMLRMLPGLEFNTALRFDSNDFLVNNAWAEYGAQITWNLFNLFSGPARIDAAEAEETVAIARRQALSMAVLAQLYVANANFADAVRQYGNAQELSRLDGEILTQLQRRFSVRSIGELELIQGELRALEAELQRDLRYAELRNAYGQIFVTIGADPLPDALPSDDISAISSALATTEAAWANGDVRMMQPPI